MTLGPAKHEKVARIGRISNVFRIAGAQSAEQSVGIVGTKYILTLTSFYSIYVKRNNEKVYKIIICHVVNVVMKRIAKILSKFQHK